MRVARRLALHLLSFETAFVLFLFAGCFKADPRLAWIPVDLTLLFFLASVAAGLGVLWRERVYLPGLRLVLPFAAFTLWLTVTYAWTPGPLYGLAKVQALLSLTLWSLAGSALVIANRRLRAVRFLVLTALLGLLIALDWLSFYGPGHFTELGFIRSRGYLGVGVAFGAGALAAFTVLLYAPPLSLRWILAAVLFAVPTFTLFVIGGRSPIVALVLAMLVPLAVHLRLTRRGPMLHRSQLLVLLHLLGAAVSLGWAVLTGTTTWTLVRFASLLSQGAADSSTAPRIAYLVFALDGWARAPLLGHGVGSFGIMYLGFDFRTYPHNIFLEAMFEGGTVGLVLLVSSLLFGVMSGALVEHRFLWASLGLLLLRPLALFETVRGGRAVRVQASPPMGSHTVRGA